MDRRISLAIGYTLLTTIAERVIMAYAFLYTVLGIGLTATIGLSVWAGAWHWQAGLLVLLVGLSTVPLVVYVLSVVLLPPPRCCRRSW